MKVFMAIASLLMLVGCGGSPLDEARTCSEKMKDMYASQCIITYDGYVLSENGAISWCRDLISTAIRNCSNCDIELANWLDCHAILKYGCKNCSDEQDRIIQCCAENW